MKNEANTETWRSK